MSMKEYRSMVAEEIRLLMVGRTLIRDYPEKIEIIGPKKSPNKIGIYINNTCRLDIIIITKDKFHLRNIRVQPKVTSQITNIINGFDNLNDYIIKEFI